ncbi:MAG: cytochrome c maturation protein CcmE [Candidatus Binataceae bacterium]
MKIRSRFVVGGVLMAAAIGYLIFNAIRTTSQYYLTVNEAQARLASIDGQLVRIAGRVKAGDIGWDPATLTLSFAIAEIPAAVKSAIQPAVASDAASFFVICAGRPRPDMFAPGRDVIVEGRIGRDRIIHARQVLTSCPSKYQAKQEP